MEAAAISPIYIDIHCHRRTVETQPAIVSLDPADVNPSLLAGGYYSLGIHPWHLDGRDWQAATTKIAALAHDPQLLAIGECGLDKAIATPLALQLDVFSRQIELSEQLGKPLTVHCARAFGELLQLKKAYSPAQPWIIHGFSGKPALARQLLQHGCYLSFGQALIDKQALRDSLLATPSERLFLETDAATDVTIGEIYAIAAKILDLDLTTLQRLIVANFNRVFAHD